MTQKSIQTEISSDLKKVDGVCLAIKELLKTNRLEDRWFGVELLLREFINNAILHGNRRDPDKSVRIKARVGWRSITISITDQGKGFDWRAQLRKRPQPDDTSGRGLWIGSEYADRVVYNRAGNRVVLVIRKKETEIARKRRE